MLKRLLQKFKKPTVKVRQKPEDNQCPFCAFGSPIIYDQEHDCCTTCKSKWAVAH